MPGVTPRTPTTLSLYALCQTKYENWEILGLFFVPEREWRPYLSRLCKVNESSFHIGADQLDAELMADVQTFKTARQSTFNGRMQDTDPGAFGRCAGDDGIELLADPGL